MYGSDLSFGSETRHDDVTAEAREHLYLIEWRYFSTDDTFDYHGHRVEGLNLLLTVSEKLYHDNAMRWIPGIDASVR